MGHSPKHVSITRSIIFLHLVFYHFPDFAATKKSRRPKAAAISSPDTAGTYSLVYCIIPRLLVTHRPFAVAQAGSGRVHDHPDQPQERQHLVHHLNDTAIFKLQISPLQFLAY